MSPSETLDAGEGAAPRGPRVPPATAWECFYRSIRESLEVWPRVLPICADENVADSTVRAMQRARRHAWLHARHGLNWSMFESIRISVRLAEAFAAWTRSGAPDLDVLAASLRRVENGGPVGAPGINSAAVDAAGLPGPHRQVWRQRGVMWGWEGKTQSRHPCCRRRGTGSGAGSGSAHHAECLLQAPPQQQRIKSRPSPRSARAS